MIFALHIVPSDNRTEAIPFTSASGLCRRGFVIVPARELPSNRDSLDVRNRSDDLEIHRADCTPVHAKVWVSPSGSPQDKIRLLALNKGQS